jgi:hypothetical protein
MIPIALALSGRFMRRAAGADSMLRLANNQSDWGTGWGDQPLGEQAWPWGRGATEGGGVSSPDAAWPSYRDPRSHPVLPDGIVYREDVPTVAAYDPERIMEEVRAARAQADVVVVSLHWGVEYTREPQESQRRIARALIDAGATLVVGHHTHTPQPVERYRQGLIAYSLGNFVFDPVADRAAHGLLLTCTLAKGKVKSYRVRAVRIGEGRPR